MTTNNGINTSLSGQTGTGEFVGSTSPTFITPILGAASATSLTLSSTSGVIGTTTNNNAAAGSVGEFISSVIPLASAVSLTTTIAANVTSISLTAGDWNVWGNVSIVFSVGGTDAEMWISETSATVPDQSLFTGLAATIGIGAAFSVPQLRFSLGSTTTIYLSSISTFASGTAVACGGIYARRIR
jgi:hypothetical protein